MLTNVYIKVGGVFSHYGTCITKYLLSYGHILKEKHLKLLLKVVWVFYTFLNALSVSV